MRALLDLVLPVECAGCGHRGTVACPGCLLELNARAEPCWPRPSPPGLPPPWAVTAYAGRPREFLLAYKEEGIVGLRRPLGVALATAVRAGLPPDDRPVVIVPVPSSRAARRRRGRDHVAELARVAAAKLRAEGRAVEVVCVLRHARRVADSAGLTAAERSVNLAGAFAVRAPCRDRIAGTSVVVVDDVVTTGVTLTECTGALRAAGANVLAAASVAATRRRAVDR
ncbi:MAG TPA: phosphoribosyltransferase family protein [Mycobacteriales bacterium]|nr:phosphoribosyltransferase family protein [Mycobacteriales bacterium]